MISAVVLSLSLSVLPPMRPPLPPAKWDLHPLSLPVVAEDPWLGNDKARHFTVSLLMSGMLAYTARHQWRMAAPDARFMGVCCTFSVGMVKELWDKKTPGHCASLRDLAADLAGALIGGWLLSW